MNAGLVLEYAERATFGCGTAVYTYLSIAIPHLSAEHEEANAIFSHEAVCALA